MHDPAFVGRRQAPRDLSRELERRRDSEPPPTESLPQALARDELHRDEDATVVLADLMNDRDVGVRDARGVTGFAEQALPLFVIAPLGKQFECDVPPELLIVRAVDDAHSPAAQHAENAEVRDARGNDLRRPVRDVGYLAQERVRVAFRALAGPVVA